VTERRAEQPNVVLINCDDLGYGDLGCYGSTRNATPAIDALAAEGLRLTSFYMASPVCSPSRGAMLTGCYPPRIGFGSFDGLPVLFPGQALGLNPKERSLARVLSDAGYRTQMIGKWHCGDQPGFLPCDHGFDHYFGLPYSNDMGRQTNTPEILQFLPPLPLLADDVVVEEQPDQRTLTERYVTASIDFLRDAKDGPFFLYLAHLYVHLPIYISDERLEAARNGRYGAAVECIDWATSKILDELVSLGLDEKTIVIFTSDNGSLGDTEPPWGSMGPIGASNEPLRGVKGTTWEGGMRVPGIVRWPGTIEPGRVCDGLLTSMDLLPTLAGLCGATLDDARPIDGKDVADVWLAGSSSPHQHFAYFRGTTLEAVRGERYKLHVARGGDVVVELYDLLVDPSESRDIAGRFPDEVASLQRVADGYRSTLGDDLTGVEGTEIRPAARVAEPVTLTTYDPAHPYVVAEYDLDDRG